MKISKLTFAALLLIASVPLAVAQGTYTQIDYPGAANGTLCRGIDAAGNIIGSYEDAVFDSHSFLLSGSTYTTTNYPGAASTWVFGVNNIGQIVGYSNANKPPVSCTTLRRRSSLR
jgi:hypothetical protein